MKNVFVCLLLLLSSFCISCESKTFKLVRVERHPNSLEYSNIPFNKQELLIAKAILKKWGYSFTADSSGQIFLPDNQQYGDGPKLFMWTLSDEIADSVYRSINFVK